MSSEVTTGQTPDVYGQVHPVETPELIQTKLIDLQKELAQLPDEKTVAWKQAQKECPTLVNEDFMLQFLRCEVYNTDVSVESMKNCVFDFLVKNEGRDVTCSQDMLFLLPCLRTAAYPMYPLFLLVPKSWQRNDWSSIGKNESKYLVLKPFYH